ncbi:MAG: sugar ABC transporter substrate-binding protein [Spirochaetes bacterium]|nr:sugar ABC transporter substrate-binding protein [Spirochaetota bacterium]
MNRGVKFLLGSLCFVFILGMFVFSNCTKKGDVKEKNELEIAIWGNIKEVIIIEESIKLFNEKYPDIIVTISHSPQGQGYIDRILTRAASGSMPDIMFCEVNFIDKFIEKDMLMDISGLLAKDRSITEKDYFPQIISRFKKGEKLYGLPRDVAPFACIFYNKNLFDQAGVPYPKDSWSMAQFLETAKKLTKISKSGIVNQYGFYGWAWQNFVYSFGGKIVDNVHEPRKCLLNQANAIKGLEFYRDLIYKYKVMPSPSSVETGYNEMFMTGRIAMYGSGIWDTPVLRDTKDFKWDVAMFPKGPGGRRGFATGGSGYAISKSAKNLEMAYELLKVISGEYGQKKLAEAGLAQPALKKLAYGPLWAGDKVNPPVNKGMLNEAVEYIIFNPFIANWSEVEQKIIYPRIDLIVRNQINTKKAMDEIAKEIDQELQK